MECILLHVSYSVGRGSFTRVKQTEREANHSPHLVPKLRMRGFIPPIQFMFLRHWERKLLHLSSYVLAETGRKVKH